MYVRDFFSSFQEILYEREDKILFYSTKSRKNAFVYCKSFAVKPGKIERRGSGTD